MSSSASLWRLDSPNTSLLLITDGNVPQLHYFGERLLSNTAIEDCTPLADSSALHASLDQAEVLTLFPEASRGHAGSPGLSGHRDGQQFAHRWALISTDQDNAANALVFRLVDDVSSLELELKLALNTATDVLSVHTSLTNTGTADYTVDWLASATVPLPQEHLELLSQHGRWGSEFREYRRTILPGVIDISNRHGRTSHEHAPMLMTGPANFGNAQGDVLCAHLAWSGNFSMRVERLADGEGSLQLGLLPLPGEIRLAPQERFDAPPALLARGTGINAITQCFHEHARRYILPTWTRTPRPVHANSWEALYFEHSVKNLISLIDASAKLGAERFVLDDGWFGRRRNDQAGLGDWFVDPTIYPEGLHPVCKRVREHGMQFGLWFEPEMVNPDSALYEEHPEWVLQLDGIDTPLARYQLVLDIARTDVRDYLFERIVSLVNEYAIDYIKWDMNRDLVLAGDGTHARAAKQPLALYQLLEDIQAACPQLEIETCSSGGARVDFGILAHTGRVWASDNIDPIERARIQAGFLRLYPPEIMGAHVGHKAAHLTGRETPLHTRAIVALQGQYGFEIDARKLDEQERLALAYYTELYKTHREWLSQSRYYRLDMSDDSLWASTQVADDGNISLTTVIASAAHPHSRSGYVKLAGLEAQTRYVVTLASNNKDDIKTFSRSLPEWIDKPASTTGELLMRIGLPLPVLPPQSALLIFCRRS